MKLAQDFDNAFVKTSEALEAGVILILSALITLSKGITGGLEKAKTAFESSTHWAVPGSREQV